MTPQQQQILDRCKAVFATAKQFYPHLDFDKVAIRFDLVGRCAGVAGRKGGVYYMRFNRDMLNREAFEHVQKDTVPHEAAHIVCFMDPKQGRNHDYGWAHVCRKLGGSGARTHKEEVVYGKGLTYEYTTTAGEKVRVSQQIHNRIQVRGATYTYKRGMGKINKDSAHQVVGANGRTLAAPVRKVEAKTEVCTATLPTVPSVTQQDNQARIDALKARAPVLVDINKLGTPTRTVMPGVRPAAFPAGTSKAIIIRSLMLNGHLQGKSYETVIAEMMQATGWPRQQARATYKNNCVKVGIPVQ